MGSIRNKLFRGHDPYSGFDLQNYKPDPQGWGSQNKVFQRVVERIRPKTILEVGTWKGESAIHMAKIALQFQENLEIVCIDSFNGSPEHWLAEGEIADWYASLLFKNGRPDFYCTFLANVILSGEQNVITPFPIDSLSGFQVLRSLGITAPLIYIDGDHSFEACYRDLVNFFDLLEPPGVMIIDDYLGWEGVTRAVHKFTLENEIGFAAEFGKAVIFKGIKPFLKSNFI